MFLFDLGKPSKIPDTLSMLHLFFYIKKQSAASTSSPLTRIVIVRAERRWKCHKLEEDIITASPVEEVSHSCGHTITHQGGIEKDCTNISTVEEDIGTASQVKQV